MKRIIVPVHPQQASRAALDLAAAVVAHEGGELHLLTVCYEADRARAAAHLEQIAGALAVEAKQELVVGSDVEREIVRYADRSEADAVFLNAHTGPGQVKIDIIRAVGTPVMIVPA